MSPVIENNTDMSVRKSQHRDLFGQNGKDQFLVVVRSRCRWQIDLLCSQGYVALGPISLEQLSSDMKKMFTSGSMGMQEVLKYCSHIVLICGALRPVIE